MFNAKHEHTYLPLQGNAVKTVFEPLEVTKETATFQRVEYMYMFCKCGEALKTKVKSGDPGVGIDSE